MYKLLVTDVDGTLLDRSSKLTELNKKALIDCIASGIKVIIATGKSFDSITCLIEELGLHLPQITLGGAMTITPGREIIRCTKIPGHLYLEVIQKVRGKGYELAVAAIDNKLYFQEYSGNMEHILSIGEEINKTEDLMSDYFRDNAVNISIPINSSDPLDAYVRETFSSRLHVVRSGEYFLDVLKMGSSKGAALTDLIRGMGIKKEEVVSFGDSHNDISLFKASGLGIAVKNSYPELIEIADIITDTNYNSGLGKAIYRHILKRDLPPEYGKFAYAGIS
jgi:Cof subfamily protein (haloacid dehalogenase superfamily)